MNEGKFCSGLIMEEQDFKAHGYGSSTTSARISGLRPVLMSALLHFNFDHLRNVIQKLTLEQQLDSTSISTNQRTRKHEIPSSSFREQKEHMQCKHINYRGMNIIFL